MISWCGGGGEDGSIATGRHPDHQLNPALTAHGLGSRGRENVCENKLHNAEKTQVYADEEKSRIFFGDVCGKL